MHIHMQTAWELRVYYEPKSLPVVNISVDS